MAIQITSPEDEYDHVFMSSLLISQAPLHNDNDTPVYTVSFACRYYKIDAQTGDITYKPGAVTDYVDNFYTQAVADASGGETTLMQALLANQDALARLFFETTGIEVVSL